MRRLKEMVSNSTPTLVAFFFALSFSCVNAAEINFDAVSPGDIVTDRHDAAAHGFATIYAYNNHDPGNYLVVSNTNRGHTTGPAREATFENKSNNVSNVLPVPASVWLFGAALLGFIGFSRRTTV